MMRWSRAGVFLAATVVLVGSFDGGLAQVVRSSVSQELHDRALAVLREAVAREESWVKVHAAESLLWTGHPQGVYDTFVRELDAAGPQYRIGVWRVLAQATEGEESDKHRAKILDAFLDVDGPDRLHAAETLGKLGHAGKDEEFRRVATGHHSVERAGAFEACARWVLANSGDEPDEAALAALLESEDPEARGVAAYAFRFFECIRPASYAKLKAAAEREPEDSSWRVNLLSTWYVHAPEDERPSIKTKLVRYARNGGTGDKREACVALGRIPDTADVPLLARLLDDAEMDVRTGAAETFLRIEARLGEAPRWHGREGPLTDMGAR